jgi:hypothetical protein
MTNEIEECLYRHLDAIAEAMKEPEEPDVVHSSRCSYGKRMWLFSWKFPFVITWISRAWCCCGINEIVRGNRRMQHNIDDIVEILDNMRD